LESWTEFPTDRFQDFLGCPATKNSHHGAQVALRLEGKLLDKFIIDLDLSLGSIFLGDS